VRERVCTHFAVDQLLISGFRVERQLMIHFLRDLLVGESTSKKGVVLFSSITITTTSILSWLSILHL
jgi:hypothetical protein